MRTEAYLIAKKSCTRHKIRQVLYWPAVISQYLGCFPFILNRDNEYIFQWTGLPMIFTGCCFLFNLICIAYYFLYKEEIVTEIMGDLTNTENYASSFITGFILVVDKSMTIYALCIRKSTIKFQKQLNTVFEHIVSEVNYNLIFTNSSSITRRSCWDYIEQETKFVRKTGLVLLGIGFVFELTSAFFHVTRLFYPATSLWRKLGLVVVCILGQCSLTIPKLCFLYYISSIISLFKGGFLILKDVTKSFTKVICDESIELAQPTNAINYHLETYSKLEKLVVKYNRVFGVQILGCMIVSLVLITGYAFLICVNIGFNFWYVVVVAIPLTAIHCITLIFLCHNASNMTIAAQKTIVYLRHSKASFSKDEGFKIMLFYSKAVSSPPAICPLNFIAVNYQTLISAATIITTYLFVLLQFRVGEKAPSCKGQFDGITFKNNTIN